MSRLDTDDEDDFISDIVLIDDIDDLPDADEAEWWPPVGADARVDAAEARPPELTSNRAERAHLLARANTDLPPTP